MAFLFPLESRKARAHGPERGHGIRSGPAAPRQHTFFICHSPLIDHQTHTSHRPTTRPHAIMQYTFLALALAALAVAVPQKGPGAPGAGGPPGPLCPSIDTPLCCQLDLDEVVDSTCSARK